MTPKRLRTSIWLAPLALVVSAGCASGGANAASAASAPAPSAATAPPLSGEQDLVDDRLIFGRDIPTGGQVSDSAWSSFLAEVITPVFPAGLTVMHSEGQWLDPRGNLWKEPGIIVEFLHPPGTPADSVFERISNEYRRRFHQDAVLRETMPAHTWLYEGPIRPTR